MSAPSESSTVAAAVSPPEGATRWFSEEVCAHDAQLKAYLKSSFPAIRDVEDIAQESYVRIWKGQFFGRVKSAKAFLFRVARNLAVDRIRSEARSPIQTVPDLAGIIALDTSHDAAERAATNDDYRLALEAIDSLPRRCREVVVLRLLCGYSPAEIAAELGIAEGTVHLHGAKGARKIDAYLRAHGVSRPSP